MALLDRFRTQSRHKNPDAAVRLAFSERDAVLTASNGGTARLWGFRSVSTSGPCTDCADKEAPLHGLALRLRGLSFLGLSVGGILMPHRHFSR